MPLPEDIPLRLEKALTQEGLLETNLAKEVIEGLKSGKPIKWNLLLAKQLQTEKEVENEADH